jgi:hypothetical protein
MQGIKGRVAYRQLLNVNTDGYREPQLGPYCRFEVPLDHCVFSEASSRL